MSRIVFLGSRFQAFDDDGSVVVDGEAYFYEPGTLDKKDTYTSKTYAVANANPVQLDANGRATIWLDGDYRCIIKRSDGTTVSDDDGINPDDDLGGDTYNGAVNGSFENHVAGVPIGWTLTTYTNGTVERITTDAYHGVASLRMVSPGGAGNGGGFADSDFFEVNPGLKREVSFALKSSVVDIRNVVQVLWYDSAQALLSTTDAYDDSTTNPTSWTVFRFVATPPSGARYARIRLIGCHDSDSTAGNVLFDDVRFPVTILDASGQVYNKSEIDAGLGRLIGEVFALQDDIAGVPGPDNSGDRKFIKLTAGLTGAGQYNEGLLTSESTSGSSPNITATAVISHTASPMDGQTVRLINTEERFLRAGNAGTTQDSLLATHGHSASTGSAGGHSHSRIQSGFDAPIAQTDRGSGVTACDAGIATSTKGVDSGDMLGTNSVGDHSHSVSIGNTGGNETRPRNVGTTYYMRIA